MDVKTWCDNIATLIADALVDSAHIRNGDLSAVSDIISEELFVRLLANDYPPPKDDASQESES